jgi:hypothetical protein
MAKDIEFSWATFEPYQEHFWTQYGARCLAVIVFVLLVGLGNIAVMIECAIEPKGLKSYVVKRLVPLIAFAAVAAGIVFAFLPKLGAADVRLLSPWQWHTRNSTLAPTYEDLLRKHPEIQERTEPEIAGFLIQELRKLVKDSSSLQEFLNGADPKVEDSPGNFTIEKQADQVILRVYDLTGTEHVTTIPIESADKPGQAAPASDSGKKPR